MTSLTHWKDSSKRGLVSVKNRRQKLRHNGQKKTPFALHAHFALHIWSKLPLFVQKPITLSLLIQISAPSYLKLFRYVNTIPEKNSRWINRKNGKDLSFFEWYILQTFILFKKNETVIKWSLVLDGHCTIIGQSSEGHLNKHWKSIGWSLDDVVIWHS